MLKQLNMDKQVYYDLCQQVQGIFIEQKGSMKLQQRSTCKPIGINHNDYASVLMNLGNIYRIKGEYETAIKAYEQAKQIFKVKLGINHKDYASVLVNLGKIYQMKGEYETAIKVYVQAKQIYKVKLGTNHTEYATALVNLGNVYQIKGEYETAINVYEKVKQIRRTKLGVNHKDYASVLMNLGSLFRIKGQYESAIKIYEQAKQIFILKLGHNSNEYADVLVNLGNAYQATGEYESAINLYKQAQQIRRINLGSIHKDYATVLINLGNLYQTIGEYESAIKVYEQAKQTYKVKLGINHNDYAAVLMNLGVLYKTKGEYKQSFSLFQSSIQIFSSSLGQLSFQYITTLLNLCDLLFSVNQFDKCLKKLLHCQSKLILLFKSQPIRPVQQLLIKTTKLLCDVYEKKNLVKEKEICMRQCVKLTMQLMGLPQNQIQTMVENRKHTQNVQSKNRQLNAQIFDICLQFLIVHGQSGLSYIQLISHLPQQVQSARNLMDEEMIEACRYIISDLLARQNLVEAEQTIKFVQFLGFNLPDQVKQLNLLKKKYQKKLYVELISRNHVLCSWQTEEKKQMERQIIRIMGKNSRLYVLMKWLQINELRMRGRYEEAEVILEDALKAIDEDQVSVEMLQVLWNQL